MVNKNIQMNLENMVRELGAYQTLNHLLLSEEKRTEGEKGIKFMDYNKAKVKGVVPGFISQLYGLEMMFPPKISFMGGLINGGNLELLSDFENKNSIAQIAIKNYPHNEKNDYIAERVLGKIPENLSFVIGYAQANIETNKSIIDLGFRSYVCSVITAHDFRMTNGIGKKMIDPIMETIDGLGKSYLTTWVDTG